MPTETAKAWMIAADAKWTTLTTTEEKGIKNTKPIYHVAMKPSEMTTNLTCLEEENKALSMNFYLLYITLTS